MNTTVEQFNGQKNQFIIRTPDGLYFQSYNTVIVRKHAGKVWLDREKWNVSPTTSKHRNAFLRETTAETEAKIASGEYKLADLN